MCALFLQPEHGGDLLDDCCCAEMRCCTPEIVTATVSGFSGNLIPKYCVLISGGRRGLPPDPNDDCGDTHCPIPAYTNPGTFTGVYSRILDSSATQPNGDCCGVSCSDPHDAYHWECPLCGMPTDPCEAPNICTSDVLWSLSAFPPKTPVGSPHGTLCFEGYNLYDAAYNTDITWVTDTSIDCAAAPLLCEMPPAGGHYGASPRGSVCREEDLNGSLVLRRNAYGLRPELYAKVNRSKAAPTGAIDAVLRFDVFCRRYWLLTQDCPSEFIFALDCTTQQREYATVESPPGTWFCVDYFCGPRLPDEDHGGGYCDRYQCTAPYGYVWPHLLATSDSGNNSANIIPELSPASYDEGWLGTDYATNDLADKAQVPYEWIVKSLNIKKAGSGYSVGDFFTIDFDPAWAVHRSGQPRGFSLTGQLATPLSATPVCHAAVTWKDKYGAVPYGESYDEYGELTGYYCQQRARVSAVGSRGEITEIEVVPWYQTPEFKNGDCSTRITKDKDKTPFYIRMYRVLCHPLSVVVGGSGYSVGDTITWYCKDPACATHTPAKAVVTDVDDNGAVLDWHINGSDICMYGSGGWSCSSSDESVAARPDCSRHPYKTTDYLDERGAYKFDGKNLCELNWIGYKPARAASNYEQIYQANTGRLCGINPSISKQPCRTTFSLTRYQYGNPVYAPDGFRPYRYSSGLWLSIEHGTNEGESLQDEMLLKFPPYPPSEAGGAEIALTFGSESQNFNDPTRCESLGGPVQTANVIAGGTGFAFKDKTHVQPVLPLTLGQLSIAEAESEVSDGAVNKVTVTKGGYGYSSASPPAVTFSAPSEAAMTATGVAVVGSDGKVSSVTITEAGHGYFSSSNPSVTFSAPHVVAVTATGKTYVGGNGRLTSVEVTLSGDGYKNPPTVTISAPSGAGSTATATATIGSDGRVTGVTLSSPGDGYLSSSPPTVTFSAPPKVEITATGTVVVGANGRVSSVTISEDGEGYSSSSPPTVTFSAPSGGHEAATGTAIVGGEGRVSGITLTKPGVGYEAAPTVTIDPPASGGSGAKLKSFSFSTVSNFPGINYSKGEPYSASAMRFAYFPVSGVVIDGSSRGVGYKVGDTFQIKPEGGDAYIEPWGAGGDDPDSCPNGAWYEGSYSTGLHEDGRLSTPFFTSQTSVGGEESRESFCILRVSEVNETGGVTDIEVVEGGMMFRSQYTTGVKHPEIFPQVSSDTGVGCEFTHTVDTNISSNKFGEVTGVRITNGGHYYANPPSGWMWMMNGLSVGGEIFDPPAQSMAHADWKTTPNSSTNLDDMGWVVVTGSPPPIVPKASACLIGECYHALLNRTYLLFRSYNLPPGFEFDKAYNRTNSQLVQGLSSVSLPELWPSGSWCLLRKKSAVATTDPNTGGTYYGPDAYTVIEWGQTITLSASIPSTCPDQTNGRNSGYEY